MIKTNFSVANKLMCLLLS